MTHTATQAASPTEHARARHAAAAQLITLGDALKSRDRIIRQAASAGIPKTEIAALTGLSRATIADVVKRGARLETERELIESTPQYHDHGPGVFCTDDCRPPADPRPPHPRYRSGDDLLADLAKIAPRDRAAWLAGMRIRLLREAADLCGIDSAELGERGCIAAIITNF